MNDEDAGHEADASTDASMGSYVEACNMCLGTTCATQLDTCDAEPKCMIFATCMTNTRCWNEPIRDFNNPPACIMQCSMEAGIVSQVDPALAALVPILMCAQDAMRCAPMCAPDLVP